MSTTSTPNTVAVVRAAAAVLATAHTAAVRNDYGACTVPGYAVAESTHGLARVHHQLPNLNLLDPNRLSGQERWAQCRARVNAYAATLEAAGWTVEHKTVTTGAILLASPPDTAPTAHVAYAYSKRQGPNSLGQYHAVLDQAFQSGRYRRNAGDTLCPKRSGFWGLEERLEMAAPTCPGCAAAADRHGITIRTEASR